MNELIIPALLFGLLSGIVISGSVIRLRNRMIDLDGKAEVRREVIHAQKKASAPADLP